MSDVEGEPEVVPEGDPAPEEPGEVEEEACVEVKVEKKRKEHGLLREEQQNVVVQPLLTGKIQGFTSYDVKITAIIPFLNFFVSLITFV
jgi:hypothetical protein